jgi:hypothetical protein
MALLSSLETGAIVAIALQEADQGDSATIQKTLREALEQLEAVAAINDEVKTGEELVDDKGYHSKQTLLDMQSLELRTDIGEPNRGATSPRFPDKECFSFSCALLMANQSACDKRPSTSSDAAVIPATQRNSRLTSLPTYCPVRRTRVGFRSRSPCGLA